MSRLARDTWKNKEYGLFHFFFVEMNDKVYWRMGMLCIVRVCVWGSNMWCGS